MINLGKLILVGAILLCSGGCAKSINAKPISDNELYNLPLMGLDIDQPAEKDIYKKYMVALSCREGTAGIYINSAKKQMRIGSTFDPISESSLINDSLVLAITSINNEGGIITITANSVEEGKFIFSFSKAEDNILTLTVKEAPPPRVGYGDWGFAAAYTSLKDEKKYKERSCEDYEG